MGCGRSKVSPESPKKSCASVVRSLVAFRKARDDDGGPKEQKDQSVNLQFSSDVDGPKPKADRRGRRDAVEKYRDKFEPRVTARYDIQALIGRGSFSRVVRGEHRATRRPFAIKMMELEAPGGREACASELAVLRRVSHTNVIQLIEVFQFPRRVYVVLELATGGELLDRVVSKGHFTERDAAQALRMVLAGLGYLHSLGIAHRDLKPENLLYYHPGPDSRLLVTDFGLASFGGARSDIPTKLGGEESLRTTCGTPEYMAPEILLRRAYSCAVDMWALGVIAFIVLSGSMPFEDDSRSRLYGSVVKGKFGFNGNPWPSVSSPAKDFILRLLVLDPAARLTAAQAVRHPWVVSTAGGSSRNLHRSISRNLRWRRRRQRASRASSQCLGSAASSRDANSVSSGRRTSPEKRPRAAAGRSSWTEPSLGGPRKHKPGASTPSNRTGTFPRNLMKIQNQLPTARRVSPPRRSSLQTASL